MLFFFFFGENALVLNQFRYIILKINFSTMDKISFLIAVAFVAAFLTVTTAVDLYSKKTSTIIENRATRRKKK